MRIAMPLVATFLILFAAWILTVIAGDTGTILDKLGL